MELPKAQSPKYVAILALVSGLILVVGWLVRPREIAQIPAPLPSPNELAQLARRSERRSLDSMSTYFAVTADEAASSIVQLPGTGASGVAWDTDVIVTAPLPHLAADAVTVSLASGEVRTAEPRIWGPGVPLAAVATNRDVRGPGVARRAASMPAVGTWVIAVWQNAGTRGFAPGTFLQLASARCGATPVQEVVSSFTLGPVMAGGGLFDIDANLLAVILPCDARFAAIAASSVDAIVRAADTNEQRLLARYGLVVGALADDERSHFKVSDGVIVREVWSGYRGDAAGLRPGDIIIALDAAVVQQEEDLLALTRPSGDAALALTVRRGRATLTIPLGAAAALEAAGTEPPPSAGLVWASSPRPYRIDSVVPGSRAALAGLEPGDRLVRIDHTEPRNATQVERIFAGDAKAPVLLEVERDDRRLALLVR